MRVAGPIRTVLAASDGSETAAKAVAKAGELAEALHARLVLVGVRNPVGVYRDPDLSASEIGRDDLEVSVRDPVGTPSEAILDTAAEEGADLIVLGDRGMSGPGRFLLGSVANRVSHDAPCSVLIVREREERRPRRARGVSPTHRGRAGSARRSRASRTSWSRPGRAGRLRRPAGGTGCRRR